MHRQENFSLKIPGEAASSAPNGGTPPADRWTCWSRRPVPRSRAWATLPPPMYARPPPKRAAQPGWAATPYEERAAILRKAARVLEDNQEELIPWIARETGGIPAKAGFEIHLVTEGLYRSAAMCTEPQGVGLPSNPGRISIARRMPRGVVGIISPF